MMINIKTARIEDVKVLLSTLWIVVMFNMGYADILSLFIPETLEELAAFAGDTPISQLMLAGAVIVEIPLIMVILSRVLKYKVNRWANIIVGVFTIIMVIAGGSTHPHYILMATIEVVCMLLIVWYAWNWQKPAAE